MKSISKILVAITMLLSANSLLAQIKNAKTETVKIYGNCGMCEETIEKAGHFKKVANVDWNKDSQMALLTYDSIKTNQDEILKRIAIAGYDNDSFLAPDDAYAKLPNCCQYKRVNKTVTKTEMSSINIDKSEDSTITNLNQAKENDQLIVVFDNYFEVKDALVLSNGKITSEKSQNLLISINSVKMEKLSMDVHMVWMKVLNEIKEDAEHIAETKDILIQRDHFMSLSKSMYSLLKISKFEQPVYYQFCPMANDGKGAYWLSKEKEIKNPYFGTKMLTCGETAETIK